MALTYYAGNQVRGLSSDVKPTLAAGWLFFETDTLKWLVSDGASWIGFEPIVIPDDTSAPELDDSSLANLEASVESALTIVHTQLNALKNALKLAGVAEGTGLPVDEDGFPTQVEFQSITVGGDGGGLSSHPVSHTTPSGTNRLLIVAVAWHANGNKTITSVTYNSVGMTLVPSSVTNLNGNSGVALYYMINPPTGANNVAISWNSTPEDAYRLMCMSFQKAHQTTPFRTAEATTGNSTTASIAVESAVGDLVVDVVQADSNIGVGAGQTAREDGVTVANDLGHYGCSTEPGVDGDVTMSWGLSSNNWQIAAVSIRPAV